MDEIPIGELRRIVEELERAGQREISVAALLERLQVAVLIDAGELARLRELESVARRIVSTPLWELRGAEPGDAQAMRRLVLGKAESP